ncbi:Gfo/Idh/MocA family oxidoreductase [Rhodococcus erythropolis]|uniref:Gfo/Idh/MocA family oxidoreductase n=1 Tax=Rhodococcus erythropolis TaxID=1833 RepID=UPI00038E6EEB|nr:Gfo/Idh/MocA family oxidoreductase [Rhodococcus erythropolis]ERB53819.1 dehydrogenase [Rhodococcus sp. P27]EQM33890.1 dehydrogenase [Rhodococcus erythropolis DN1]MBT1254813.1 Gfo/Idh/MocA family oxidoreductase [Rhodococcus erythropolis]MCQ4124274.1 Gfo/Idh/MocA family oxidoreductase [Rhodococcus erythropolis]OHF28059.1 dehydrogenase [Rhodococcus erythropolis]
MSASVAVGLIGAGWIGRFHGESVALRIPGTRLVAVADPAPGAAASLIERVSPDARAYTDALELIADPTVEAVLISTPASTHTDLVVAAAEAGKHVFCEKPMALTLEDADRAIGACAANNVALQVGFNRRFAADFTATHDVITAGGIGTPQLLRSLTRDPGITADVASRVKPWTIFNETLIHDFDALLWLNPGARVVEVFAQADALIHPQYKEQGYLDTSMVQLRFDNGALASAEANFQATYGYDVRGEVFGSGGMVSAGEVTRTAMRHYSSPGVLADTPRVNIELFHDAYVAQLAHFADCIRSGSAPSVDGLDARNALEIALAAKESVETGLPVSLLAVPQ